MPSRPCKRGATGVVLLASPFGERLGEATAPYSNRKTSEETNIMTQSIYVKQTEASGGGTQWEGSTDRTTGFVKLGTSREDATPMDVGTSSSIQYVGVNTDICTKTITADPARQEVVNNQTVTTDLQCGDGNSTPVYIKIRRSGDRVASE